MTSERGRFYF